MKAMSVDLISVFSEQKLLHFGFGNPMASGIGNSCIGARGIRYTHLMTARLNGWLSRLMYVRRDVGSGLDGNKGSVYAPLSFVITGSTSLHSIKWLVFILDIAFDLLCSLETYPFAMQPGRLHMGQPDGSKLRHGPGSLGGKTSCDMNVRPSSFNTASCH